MPRYYFDIHNGNGHTPDEEGQDVADERQARQKAVEGARSLMGDDVLHGKLDLNGRIEVLDDEGNSIFSVGFRDVIQVSGLNS